MLVAGILVYYCVPNNGSVLGFYSPGVPGNHLSGMDMSAELALPKIDLPFLEPPAAGATFEVAKGIHWLRMPLPGRLDHVNIWLLEDEEAWTIVDCGLNNETTAEIWRQVFDKVLKRKPVKSIIVTHGHVDHVGYLGRLIEQTRAPVTMTIAEYLGTSLRIHEPHERMFEQSWKTIARCGCPPEVVDAMITRRRDVRSSYSGIPVHYTRALKGTMLSAAGRNWEAHIFGGHSPEMLCLYNRSDYILIAGDQVLTQITPSINVSPSEPWGDPLSIFYDSFPALKALSKDTLVLPSHGMPFYGLHARIDQIREHHDQRLDSILNCVEGDVNAYQVSLQVFQRAMQTHVARQALAETLAHLHFLQNRQQVTARADDCGVVWFSRS
jgi:glyoxylase-like metal-dependent hydrolase (beta-lactamase superfamily II)